MLDNIKIENILFLDIETVPACSEYSELPKPLQKLWDEKARSLSRYYLRFGKDSAQNENKTPEDLYERAGIYAEFGKIICISVGYIKTKLTRQLDFVEASVESAETLSRNADNAVSAGDDTFDMLPGNPKASEHEFRTTSFYGDDEKELLKRFVQLLNDHYNKPQHLLCAHNGKEFDFPYLARRMLINGLKLPEILNIAGKKPWEVAHLDTMELWKFGDYKKFTSLNLLATIFDIPTPKDDIDGSDVARVYWKENDLDRIVNYCQKDVLTVAQLFLRFKGQSLIDEAKATNA